LDIADIVRGHRAALERVQRLTRSQKRVLTDIAQCRTAVLGGHLDRCVQCGYEHPSYNSCRNRHCPKCQALVQDRWIEARRARMLDVRHFHVVFTLPSELRQLATFAPRAIYGALFHAAQRTLLEMGRRRFQGTLGATLVLHTWTRELSFHPHVHAIVTGGGLSNDDTSWKPAAPRFLFPVKAMGRVFRAKMLAALNEAHGAKAFGRFEDRNRPQSSMVIVTLAPACDLVNPAHVRSVGRAPHSYLTKSRDSRGRKSSPTTNWMPNTEAGVWSKYLTAALHIRNRRDCY